jgi:hypothetical protein
MDISYLTKEQADNFMEEKRNSIERRRVEAELFDVRPSKRVMKPVQPDAKKHPDLSLRAKVRVRVYNFKQSLTGKIMSVMSKQTEKAIRKQVTDATWYGKLIFAILDVLPLPNIHEIWKAVQKELPDGTLKEKIQLFWQKVDGLRTVIAIVVALLSYYQVLG